MTTNDKKIILENVISEIATCDRIDLEKTILLQIRNLLSIYGMTSNEVIVIANMMIQDMEAKNG